MYKIQKRLGRTLDINGLQNSRKLVTLGFTIEGNTKFELANEAKVLEITLSEYIQDIVNRRKGRISPFQNDRLEYLEYINEENEKYIESLEKEIEEFKNPKLQSILEKFKGQLISYKNSDGKEKEMLVNSVLDVYKIIIDTVNI